MDNLTEDDIYDHKLLKMLEFANPSSKDDLRLTIKKVNMQKINSFWLKYVEYKLQYVEDRL